MKFRFFGVPSQKLKSYPIITSNRKTRNCTAIELWNTCHGSDFRNRPGDAIMSFGRYIYGIKQQSAVDQHHTQS